MKQANNILQSKLQTQLTNKDTIDTLQKIPTEYYQQSGPLVPLNSQLTILCKSIPHQQEIDKLMKNFSTKIMHTYNLPIHSIEFAKEYQHSPRFKDIYLSITQNQLSPSEPAQ